MFRAALRSGVLLACVVLTLSACGSSVAGRPTPAVAAGPLAQVSTSVDISDVGSADAYTPAIASDGAGGVLVVSDEPSSSGQPSRLVHYTRSDGALTPDDGRDLAQVIYIDQLLGSRSGRVVVVGQIEGDDGGAVYGVLVLDPGQSSGRVLDLVLSREEDYNVLTPDGKTLYQVLLYRDHGDYKTRVLAVDLDSAELTKSYEVPDLAPAGSLPETIGLSGDGKTLDVGFRVFDENADDGKEHGAVQRISTDHFSPQGRPIALSEPEDKLELESMGVADDGTLVALLSRFGETSRVVVLPAGSTSAKKVYETEDRVGDSLVVDRAGAWAHLLDAEDEPVSVDLGSGKPSSPVALCDGADEASAETMLAGHSGTVLVLAGCGDKEQVWVVAPQG